MFSFEERILDTYLVGDDLRLPKIIDHVGLASIELCLVLGLCGEHVHGDVRRRLVYRG